MTKEDNLKIDINQPLDTMLHNILNQALISIGAKAGSIMLVNLKRGILQIKARLGEPRSGRVTEPVYKIKGRSIASWVVQHKKAYLCGDVHSDRFFIKSRSGNNFRSLLSAPIIYKDNVIAVINADATEEKKFDKGHQAILEQFSSQIAKSVGERMSILDALAEIGIELTKRPHEGSVDLVLQKIADAATNSLGISIVTLYQYVQKTDEFIVEGTGPTIGGKLKETKHMRRRVYEGDVPRIVVKQRKSGFYSNVHEHKFLTGLANRPGEKPRPRFINREGIESMAALLLPNRAAEDSTEEVVGVMFANYKSKHEFNIDEMSALRTFADYAAVAIMNARREEERRKEQLRLEKYKKAEEIVSVLADITSAVVGNLGVGASLNKIIDITMNTLHAEACSIYLLDSGKKPEILRCRAAAGFTKQIADKAEYEMGEGLTGTIAKTGQEVNIKDKYDLKKFKEIGSWKGKYDDIQWKDQSTQFRNLIALPLKIKNQISGVIKAENKIISYGDCFTDEDLISFKTIANVIALTVENARLHEKTEQQLKTIAAKAAHRINNQVTNYDSIELEILEQGESCQPPNEELKNIAQDLAETTRNLKRLVGEFKNYGKPLQLDKRLHDINKIIKNEIWLSKPPESIKVLEFLDDCLPKVLIDGGRFAEAIKELLRNAIRALEDYEKKDKTIYVKTQLSQKTDDKDVRKFIDIIIIDNGPGIEENFPIVEPFQTTYPQSTGLGLVTVKELIEAHNGKMDVESYPNKGFTVNLSIPLIYE